LLPESYRLARKREVLGKYLKNSLYIQIYGHIICEELQDVLEDRKSEEHALFIFYKGMLLLYLKGVIANKRFRL